MSQATVFRWARQDRVDRGQLAGTSTAQSAELRAAKARIAELEAELATVKRASELLSKGRVVRPKEIHSLVATLVAEGHGAKRCCRILAISSAGFFRSLTAPLSARVVRRAWLADAITEVHARSRGTYGALRVKAELADYYGPVVNKKLIRKVMSDLGLSGLPKRRRGKPNFKTGRRARTWSTGSSAGTAQLVVDDRYHRAQDQGRQALLLRLLDAWSRRIVGWSIDRRPTVAMVNSALGMAIEARKPTAGAVVHSDHGSQYSSWTFSQRVRAAGLARSLGTVGEAFDNAMVESLWARMQTELLNTRPWKTRVELSSAIFDWIEGFYNRVRRHSSLGTMSPIEFEKLHTQATSAA